MAVDVPVLLLIIILLIPVPILTLILIAVLDLLSGRTSVVFVFKTHHHHGEISIVNIMNLGAMSIIMLKAVNIFIVIEFTSAVHRDRRHSNHHMSHCCPHRQHRIHPLVVFSFINNNTNIGISDANYGRNIGALMTRIGFWRPK